MGKCPTDGTAMFYFSPSLATEQGAAKLKFMDTFAETTSMPHVDLFALQIGGVPYLSFD